jgi:peptidoglycan/LPS O-acetylase OafA/YrhL
MCTMSRPETTSISQVPTRLRSLDGLRGVAAAVVLFHHSLLLVPGFSATYQGGALPTQGSVIWWLSYTPLKLLTAGGESVIVFFVLSGLVVALPVLKRPTFDWIAYYPRRVVRLALPIFGSIMLAVILIVLVRQTPFQAPGTWLYGSSTPHIGLSQVLAAANLFGDGTNFQINNPLWSLRWELYFSLALPIFVLLAVAARRRWIAAGVFALLLTLCGRLLGFEPLYYFPSFFLGALIAAKIDYFRGLADRINARRLRHLIWASLALIGYLLLIASWLVGPLPASMSKVTVSLHALTPIGASFIVIACFGWGALDRLLSMRVPQLAGKLSFSLYLTHVPVLIFTSYLLQGRPLSIVIVVGDCLAVAVAAGFFWLVEARCHVFSKRVGAWASSRIASYHANGSIRETTWGI